MKKSEQLLSIHKLRQRRIYEGLIKVDEIVSPKLKN
jgi:hypothetical protein